MSKTIIGGILTGDETPEETIALKKASINKETTQKILYGVEYKDVKFYLTRENQSNFAELDRLRNELTYPFEVWCGDNSVFIQDTTEMHQFYMLGMQYIQTCLSEGKAERDAL